MAVRDVSSYIYRMGTAPNTRFAVSQKNKIFGYLNGGGNATFKQIGAVSEFGFSESRSVEPVRGVGFGDQIAELVPGVTEPMSITLNRSLMYATNLFQVVGYKGGVEGLVRSLRHHRWPFDLKQELVFPELVTKGDDPSAVDSGVDASTQTPGGEGFVGGSIKALMTWYEGCWFQDFNASFTSDTAIIVENSTILVTDVIDGASPYGEYIDSGLAPVGANGGAGTGYSLRFSGGAQANTTVGG